MNKQNSRNITRAIRFATNGFTSIVSRHVGGHAWEYSFKRESDGRVYTESRYEPLRHLRATLIAADALREFFPIDQLTAREITEVLRGSIRDRVAFVWSNWHSFHASSVRP